MESKDCIFCKIIAGQIPCLKIYENEQVLAFLDIGPVSEGHTLVIPKTHYEKLHQCPPEVLAAVSRAIGPVAAAVQQAMHADAYNVLCNNGAEAGQEVDHVHFHIIPRMADDGVFTQWPAFQYPDGKAQAIAEKIREKM